MRKNHEIHRQKVSAVRAAIDNMPPVAATLEHMRHNLKKERLLEDRYVEIDRENKVLLSKMSEIMKQPSAFADVPYSEKQAAKQASKGPVTLNRNGRKQELSRITMENQRLLKAIQSAQPVYSAKKWEADHKKSEAHLRNCSSYPVITRLPRMKSAPSLLRQIPPDLSMEDLPGSGGPSSPTEDPKLLLKEGKTIDQVYYLIEMATDGRVLNVSAYNGETQMSLELVVNEKKHRRLYRECDGDYSRMAERLRVENNRLMLDSPGLDEA